MIYVFTEVMSLSRLHTDTFYFESTGIHHIISIFNICMQTELNYSFRIAEVKVQVWG